MVPDKTNEDLKSVWWKEWWAEDYSWAGLNDPQKNIAGDGGLHGAISLQDYWRIDPSTGDLRSDTEMRAAAELEAAPDDSLWHVAHVPLVWPDGTAAKSGWSDEKRAQLAAIVDARISVAQKTQIRVDNLSAKTVIGIDGRAQLQGSVFLDPPVNPPGLAEPIHILATRCWLPAWNAARHHFGPGARFDNANFSGNVGFGSATFIGYANFEDANFQGKASFTRADFADGAYFSSATFEGNANFSGAIFQGINRFNRVTFKGNARFSRAKFVGDTYFSNSAFASNVSFYSATFASKVSFYSASFANNARFGSAIFADTANFRNAAFTSSANFSEVRFKGHTLFGSVIFTGDARFASAIFTGDAWFSRATFSGDANFSKARILGNIRFGRTFFRGNASFSGASFTGDAVFGNATFTDDANFYSATFTGNARFGSARFQRAALFGNAKFEIDEGGMMKSGAMQFGKAVFAGPVDYDGAVFAANPTHHSAAFLGARFGDLVSFRGCGDHWVAALDEAEIKGRILIDERDEAISLHDFDKEVLPLARDGGDNPATRESLLKELEGGCRTIKVAMGAARNEIMEQRYYRFQLLARREQAGVPDSERLVSYVFGWTADYGLSMTRPLAGLAITLITFNYIYAMFWNATGSFDGNSLIKSMEMAASRMFPFGAFEDISKDWFTHLEKRGAYPWTLLLARLFASLQSLFALLLIFMFGLAVRRRFKVGE
jgi:hypothetical protein